MFELSGETVYKSDGGKRVRKIKGDNGQRGEEKRAQKPPINVSPEKRDWTEDQREAA